ncbi:MAG: hypothetical protein Q9219_003135 [cf. Caloplaca sp. 3 TL-2023]
MSARINPRVCFQLCQRISRPRPSNLTKFSARSLSQWHQRPNVSTSRQFKAPLLHYQQLRHKTLRAAARDLYNEYPLSVALASICILITCLGFIYANQLYRSYIIGSFTAYPEPIARALRRALYYSNHDLQPQLALKYYTKALDLATETGLDPLSDEILGVKFQLAAFLEERVHKPKVAIDVLERVKQHCGAWIQELGGGEGERGKRTRVLGQMVRVSVKLGELYARPDVMETEQAEESLVWAVTTLLKEQERRGNEGVQEGEGKWLSVDEIGATLESLATHYTTLSRPYLATPLYLQALPLLLSTHNNPCHATALMINLSASLYAQISPSTPYDPPADRDTLLANATAWAQKALDTAAQISPPERNEECDRGCVVATLHLAAFAEARGEWGVARRRYGEAGGLGKAIGWGEGVGRAEEGVRGLEGKGE